MCRVGGLLQNDDDETASNVLHPNRLAEERLRAGYATPERLAAALGVDPAWYAQIEAGHVMPTDEPGPAPGQARLSRMNSQGGSS